MSAESEKAASEKLIQFLNEKWGGRPCPMCSKGPWEVQGKIFQLNEFSQGNLVLGGPILPVVPVSCTNCGYTVLVNALLTGVLEKPASPPEKPK